MSVRRVFEGALAALGLLLAACGDGGSPAARPTGELAERAPWKRVRFRNEAPGRVVRVVAVSPLDRSGSPVPGAGIPLPLPPKGLAADGEAGVDDPPPRPSWVRVHVQVHGVKGTLECDSHDFGADPPAGTVSIEDVSVRLVPAPPDGLRLVVTTTGRADGVEPRTHVTSCPP